MAHFQVGIKKRTCRTLMWPKDPKVNLWSRFHTVKFPSKKILFGKDIWILSGIRGPTGRNRFRFSKFQNTVNISSQKKYLRMTYDSYGMNHTGDTSTVILVSSGRFGPRITRISRILCAFFCLTWKQNNWLKQHNFWFENVSICSKIICNPFL